MFILLAVAAFVFTPGGVARYAVPALALLGVALLSVRLMRRRSAGAKGKSPKPGAGISPAALRSESDIIRTSFDEDGVLLEVVELIDGEASATAIKTIHASLGCSLPDAQLLVKEVRRAAMRLREKSAAPVPPPPMACEIDSRGKK